MVISKRCISKLSFFVFILLFFVSCYNDVDLSNRHFKVSFYSNEKVIGTSQTVKYGQVITEPSVPQKLSEDTYFVGWFKEDGTQWDFSWGVADNMHLSAKFDLIALKFESKSSFKITPQFADNVNLTYSVDFGSTWIPCENNQEIAVKTTIYFRGIDNEVITGDLNSIKNWTITSDNGQDGIRCSGNIEALLDWEDVVKGIHPTMGNNCFFGLFSNCAHLVSAPQLPATSLTDFCYAYMFFNCTNLRRVSNLPQVETYPSCCYAGMFYGCERLQFVPWKTGKEPFLIAGEGISSAALYMFNDGTPADNTSYHCITL